MKAHFDGHAVVLDEPVDLPINTALEVRVVKGNGRSRKPTVAAEDSKDPKVIARRLAAFDRFVKKHAVKGTNIPAEMLRREHLYD